MRRLAAAVACTALVGLVAPGPVGATPITTTSPAAPATQTEESGVEISGISQKPWVTQDGTWTLELAVDGAPDGAVLAARIHGRAADAREYLADSAFGVIETDDTGPFPLDFPDLPLDEATLRPDGSRAVPLAVTLLADRPAEAPPSWRFLTDGLRPGVYPVDIRVLDADGEELARVVVPITRVPSGDEEGADEPPLLVAPIVDLGSGPSITPEGEVETDPVIAEQITDLLLGVRLPGGLPMTVVPRPESIEALAREEGSEDLLDDLATALRSRQVVDGPYVDVPLGPWVERGLTEELNRQRVRGNSILTEHLGRVDSSTWDARGGLTPAAVDALWPVGVRSVILAPGAVGPEPVTGPITLQDSGGRTMEAVVPDGGLSDAFRRHDDPVLDALELAAELALAATSADGQQGVVVTPPEEWLADAPAMALAGQVLMDDDAPVRPATVAEVLEAVPSTGTRQLAPAMTEGLDDYPERLGLARARLSSYAALVGSGTAEVGSFDQQLLLSGSTDISAAERSDYVEIVLARTDARFAKVQASDQRPTVTLTSSDGDVPLVIDNGFDEPVKVTIDIRPNSRVEIRDFAPTQELDPGRNRLPIPVHTRAPGDSTIEITVRTTDGEVVLDEVRYTVRSTAVPGIGVVLSIGAVLFLLVWWARHWLRDRRARREDDGGGGGGGDGPPPDEPGPDDPGADADAPRQPVLAGT